MIKQTSFNSKVENFYTMKNKRQLYRQSKVVNPKEPLEIHQEVKEICNNGKDACKTQLVDIHSEPKMKIDDKIYVTPTQDINLKHEKISKSVSLEVQQKAGAGNTSCKSNII